MADNIISYIEMCRREATSLQAGMNFGLGGNRSVILMSVRPNAPYRDRLEDGGTTLIYEGHDEPKCTNAPNPKLVDQPEIYASGARTQNGRFHQAAQDAKAGIRPPERVRVYEKIRTGIWSYNGIFHLVDSWREPDEHRMVFKFKLEAVEGEERPFCPSRSSSRQAPAHTNSRKAGGLETGCGQVRDLRRNGRAPF